MIDVMVDHGSLVERVRESVKLTREEGTAALRFEPSRIHVQPPLDEMLADRSPGLGGTMRLLGSARRTVMSHLGISELSAPVGRIDFVHHFSVYSDGDDGWWLFSPGREFIGRPGEWEAVDIENDTLETQDPAWLLALIAAAVEAEDDGPEAVLGARCHRYGVASSFSLAQMQVGRSMEPPRGNLDLERLAIDLWLDDADRIRRAIFRGDQILAILELHDFGVPDPIELPGLTEIVSDEA
jgi:hypothetical protein